MTDEIHENEEAEAVIEEATEEQEVNPVEAEARSLGWKSPEEWVNRVTGQPEQPPAWFIHDPAEWVRKHREEGPPHLTGKLSALERDLAEKNRQLEEITTFFKDYKSQEASRIEARLKRAVEDGDTDEFTRALKERDAFQRPKEPAQPQYDPDRDQNYPAWLRENPWYLSDPQLKAYAEGVAPSLGLNPATDGRAFYDAITQEVKRAFPDRFNPGQSMAQPNRATEAAAASKKKSAWSQIPKDVQRTFEGSAAVRRGIYTNDEKGREDFARDYLDTYGA